MYGGERAMGVLHDGFEASVKEAVKAAQRALSRVLQPASDVVHVYDDKFGLASGLATSTVVALLQSLSSVDGGETVASLRKLFDETQQRITLRFDVRTRHVRCTCEEPLEYVVSRSSQRRVLKFVKKTTKVKSTYKIMDWEALYDLRLVAFAGSSPDGGRVHDMWSITYRTVFQVINSNRAPVYPYNSGDIDVDITELVRFIVPTSDPPSPKGDATGAPQVMVTIDRDHKECKTPVQNAEVLRILGVLKSLSKWCLDVNGAFVQLPGRPSLAAALAGTMSYSTIFIPIVAAFAERSVSQDSVGTDERSVLSGYSFDVPVVEWVDDCDTGATSDGNSSEQEVLDGEESDSSVEEGNTTQSPLCSGLDELYRPYSEPRFGYGAPRAHDVPVSDDYRAMAVTPSFSWNSDAANGSVRQLVSELVTLASVHARSLEANKEAVTYFVIEYERRKCKKSLEWLDGHGARKGRVVAWPDMTPTLVWFACVVRHLADIVRVARASILMIENMLFSSLETVIGKVVGPVDVDAFMQWYDTQLIDERLRAVPFLHAVGKRGPAARSAVPIGTLELWAPARTDTGVRSSDKYGYLVDTFVRPDPLCAPLRVVGEGAAELEVRAKRYVHSFIQTCFGVDPLATSLCGLASAKGLSHMVVMLGDIIGTDHFEPRAARLVANGDEWRWYLDAAEQPSAKVFARQVAALSPEQREFASAVRNMKLSTAAVGVLVIEVRDLLEASLNLQGGALLRHQALIARILSLIGEHDIPVDMLAAVQPSTGEEGVSDVASHVEDMEMFLEQHKKKAIADAALAAEAALVAVVDEWADDIDGYDGVATGAGCWSVKCSAVDYNEVHSDCEFECSSESDGDDDCDFDEDDDCCTEIMSMPQKATIEENQEVEEEEAFEGADDASERDGDKEDECESDYDGTSVSVGYVGEGSSVDVATLVKAVDSKLGQLPEEIGISSLRLSVRGDTEISGSQRDPTASALKIVDQLTRSGGIPITSATLHVLVGFAHRFEATLISTVIQESVDPIASLKEGRKMVVETMLLE